MTHPFFQLALWFRTLIVIGSILLITPCPGLSRTMPFTVLADIESQAISFYKDRDGFIWIGTYVDGLYRYDGKTLKHYTKASGFILSNNIPAIIEDRDGQLWFAAAGGGLSRYDKATNTIESFSHNPKDPDSISSNSFFWAGKNILDTDTLGNLWIGTIGGGLNRFNPSDGTFTRYRATSGEPDSSLSSDNIRTVLADRKNRIWIGTEKGLDLLDTADGRIHPISLLPEHKSGKAEPMIMALFESREGNIWIGTESDGLYLYEAATGKLKNFRYHKDNPDSLLSDRINHISQDRSGRLWIAHETSFSLHRPPGETFLRHQGDNNDLTMSFQSGDSNLIWGLTDSGRLCVHNPAGHVFRQFNTDPHNPHSLSSDIVISILEDSEGMIWISTLKGLNRYNPKTGTFSHFFHEPDNSGSIPSRADYSPGLFEDDDHVLWIGNSVPSALSRFNRKTDSVEKTYYPDPADPDTLPDAQQINRMIQDAEDPEIMWIATAKGLTRFDKRSEVFQTFGRNNSWHLFDDGEGAIWLSTWGKGLAEFDKETRQFTYYSHDPENPESISDNLLVPLFVASDNRFWIGSENGLNLFDRTKGTFRRYTREMGYPFDAVHSIGEDSLGNLWLGTNAGLVRFDPETGKARAFTREDGVLSIMFYANNGITSKSGEMWFGGTKGIVTFFPEAIKTNSAVPEIVLASIRQGGDDADFGSAPERLETVVLDWRNNFFEFEFVAMDYTSPQKNQYAYKLEGLDKDWFFSGTKNFGRYSGLLPGTYTLRMKGSNNDGVWNDQGRSLTIIVTPPFWKTWWFYSGGGALILGMFLIALFYMVRLNSEVNERKKAQERLKTSNEKLESYNEQLQRLDRLKDDFMANTSHELRTPLTGIIGLAESLMDGVAGHMSDKARQNLTMIITSGKRLANLVNDILDFSKLRHKDLVLNIRPVDMQSLADVVLTVLKPVAAGKPLRLENRIPDEMPLVKGDENRLQQILFNLLGNAIKFTDSGSVAVLANTTEDMMVISVQDTGIGIPEDDHERVFASFEQVDGSLVREHSGTGLGLAVSKQLVELHGGTIGLESKPQKGSRFYFTLPLSETDRTPQKKDAPPLFQVVDIMKPDLAPDPQTKILLPDWSTGKTNILVVDDEPVNLQVLSDHLSLQDYNVTQVTNGFDAFEAINEMTRSGGKFDLILLDVMMPRMSGYEVCRRLRKEYPQDSLPVVMLTAKNRAEDLAAGLAAGANDYLTKPFSKIELMARIKNQQELKDLSDQRRKDLEALVESEKKYRDLFNNLPDAYFRTDKEGNLILVSPAVTKILGYTRDEVLGRNAIKTFCLYPEVAEDLRRKLDQKGHVEDMEIQIRKKNGEVIWALTSMHPFDDETGSSVGVEGVIRDITLQKKAEITRDRMATVIEQASELIIITDTDGIIQYVNPAFETCTGYSSEEVIGKTPSILKSGRHPKEYYENLWQTITNGNVWKGRLANRKQDGSLIEADATITPVRDEKGAIISYVAVKRDITREVRLEAQLIQSQKMESIGTLAGGIAHDFNNILSAIFGYSQLAKSHLPDSKRAANDLDQIMAGAQKAADLVRQILLFSRKTENDKHPLRIKNIIKEALKLLRSTIPATVVIKQSLQSSSRVMGDSTQMHQIIMNLCTNAYYAMRDTGGVIRVNLKDIQLPHRNTSGPVTLPPGPYVLLEVTDTGCGMDAHTLDKIFDPYFTTKEAGKGTGLGLAVVHGIVQDHQGEITVFSEPGNGSVFGIYLPVHDEEAKRSALDEKERPITGGREHIMIVDDEENIILPTAGILEQYGYTVSPFTNGVQAFQEFQKSPDTFDLVITDMTMPYMTGMELAQRILEKAPGIPIVLCTGHSELINRENALALGIRSYMEKPVVTEKLLRRIRQLLDNESTD